MMKFYKSALKNTNYINLFKGLNLYNGFFVKKHNKKKNSFLKFFKTIKKRLYKTCTFVFDK